MTQIQLSNIGNMISKKTALSTIIALTTLALVIAPSVLIFDSVYAECHVTKPGGFFGPNNQPIGNAIFKCSDDKKSSDKSSDKYSEPKTSSTKSGPSTDSNQPCKQDNSQKGTHFYCEG